MGIWISTLRSGEAEQAKGILCGNNPAEKMAGCCLGIRQMLDGIKFTYDPNKYNSSLDAEGFWVDEDGEAEMPNQDKLRKYELDKEVTDEEANSVEEILSRYGVEYDGAGAAGASRAGILAEINDTYGGFDVIADIIEENRWDNSAA